MVKKAEPIDPAFPLKVKN